MPFLNEVLVANGTTTLGRIIYSKAILDIITNDHVLTMAVNSGGTGYVVGETFELSTGTAVGSFVARGVVTAEAAGVVTGVKIISAGAYTADPTASGGATTNASAAGNDDLTIDVTMQTARWTLDTDDYVDDETDFEWICTSVKASNPATIGLRTQTSAGDDAVQLMVASAYNAIATWDAQTDTSPVANMYLNVPAQNPELFLSTTERRVNIIARDGNNVQYGGMGLFIPLTNSDATYPFPGFVHGQTRGVRPMSNQYNNDGNGNGNAGVVHPHSYTSQPGAYRYRDNLSVAWKTISANPTSTQIDAGIWPHTTESGFSFTYAPTVSGKGTNPFTNGVNPGIFSDDTLSGWFHDVGGGAQGVQGVAPFGTGSQMSFTVAAHLISNQTGDVQVIGIVDGFGAVHGVGLTAFEEIESYNENSRFIVFPDTNTSVVEDWCTMEII